MVTHGNPERLKYDYDINESGISYYLFPYRYYCHQLSSSSSGLIYAKIINLLALVLRNIYIFFISVNYKKILK